MGGKSFGARANAQNFTLDEIKAAMKFCHERGVKVYMTVNTLLKDSDLREALEFVERLCEIPADGIIIQDLGLFGILRECAPNLPLCASTQMSIHNPSGARFIDKAGAKRAVLARELSLAEIEEISRNSGIEPEVFVHGALCMSVSGQCYFSAMLGSRSGNRGMCAQPCRLPFFHGKSEYALSLKDLSAISEVKSLEKAGVASLKIEGRMKRPEYVAAAVSAVRKAVDGEEIPQDLLGNLEAVFSRSGFTNGYLEGKTGGKMFGVRTKEDVTSADGAVLKRLQALYHKERQALPVDFTLEENGDSVILTAVSGSHSVSVSLPRAEGMNKLLAERCAEQLGKTGGTPFLATETAVPAGGADITISQLNALRREAITALLEVKARRGPIPFDSRLAENKLNAGYTGKRPDKCFALHVAFRNVNQAVHTDLSAIERAYFPLFADLAEIEKLGIGKERIAFEIPRAIFGMAEEERIKGRISELKKAGCDGFICYNIGAVELCREMNAEILGGYSLNITNSSALDFFEANGVAAAELSIELKLAEVNKIKGGIPRGLMLYGHQALMLTRNCPASHLGCKGCDGKSAITDRKNVTFLVMCANAGKAKYIEVLNSVPLYMGDRLSEIKGIDYGVIRFTIESADECAEILEEFRKAEKHEKPYTRGLLYRGII